MPRPIHFEIHAADLDRAQAFYEGLLGWTVTPWGADASYRLIKTGEDSGVDGGLVQRRGPAGGADTPVIAWVCTVGVDDLDRYVADVGTLGGSIAVPRMAVPGVGWLAYAKDPDGNIFGMLQADAAAG